MFALGVHVRPLSNILHPADSLRAHRAVIAGPSRPVTPHLRGQPRPPAEEYRCGEKVQPVKNKLIKVVATDGASGWEGKRAETKLDWY